MIGSSVRNDFASESDSLAPDGLDSGLDSGQTALDKGKGYDSETKKYIPE